MKSFEDLYMVSELAITVSQGVESGSGTRLLDLGLRSRIHGSQVLSTHDAYAVESSLKYRGRVIMTLELPGIIFVPRSVQVPGGVSTFRRYDLEQYTSIDPRYTYRIGRSKRVPLAFTGINALHFLFNLPYLNFIYSLRLGTFSKTFAMVTLQHLEDIPGHAGKVHIHAKTIVVVIVSRPISRLCETAI